MTANNQLIKRSVIIIIIIKYRHTDVDIKVVAL